MALSITKPFISTSTLSNQAVQSILLDKIEHERETIPASLENSAKIKQASETYHDAFLPDIVQDPTDIRKAATFPNCQVMVGGFPCPGFSIAGPRLIDDPRNFLYVHFIRALLQTQPAFFIAENVKGLLTLAKGKVFEQVKEDFESAGYLVKAKLANSQDYGVPELRERVILVGTHRKKSLTAIITFVTSLSLALVKQSAPLSRFERPFPICRYILKMY